MSDMLVNFRYLPVVWLTSSFGRNMKKKVVFKNSYYTHLDKKKNYQKYEHLIKKSSWVKSHGFYPFIHFKIVFKKYVFDRESEKKIKKEKVRDIYKSAHIDRFIYQYYGDLLNEKYNKVAKEICIDKVSKAYRNNLTGRCNIHFAKEALEFIVKCKEAFILIGDFTSFFDKLDHAYLKEKLMQVLKVEQLPDDQYTLYKNIIKFTYLEYEDIKAYKGCNDKDLKDLTKIFDTKELQTFKKEHLHKNKNDYGIPQGSSISAIYSNVYMIDFDKKIHDYVTSKKGMYRRYCDDIIIIIPTTKNEIDDKIYLRYVEDIDSIRRGVPRLDLNLEKTEIFYYNSNHEEKLKDLKNNKKSFSYLGFSFDGEFVRIREKSLFKYYCRAYKKVKTVINHKSQKDEYTIKKSLYKLYTHLGDKKFSKDYGNFITYARRSKEVFDSSEVLENKIHDQVKRHWKKINTRLKAN